RTHQIRVHTSAIGHPCVGDSTYGADPTMAERLGLARQWLHAMQLGFTHPGTGDWTEVTSTYPADLAGALEVLRGAWPAAGRTPGRHCPRTGAGAPAAAGDLP